VATYFDAINDGETTLANTLLASETVQIIVTDGSKLPVGGAGTSGFILKLEDNLGNVEYILCSSRSGNTVYIATSGRGYEGSIARQWLSGSYIKNVFTKATKDEISDNIGDLTYTEQNYVTNDQTTTESIDALDIELKDVDDKIGNLSSLTTTDKSSTVNAINEVDSELSSHLAENAIDAHAPSPYAKVFNSTNISLVHATFMVLTFDTIISDVDNMYSTGKLVCKTAGKYMVFANATFRANTTGYRKLFLRKNGSNANMIAGHDVLPTTGNISINTNALIELAVNDYVEVLALQTSGGALDLLSETYNSPVVGMIKVG
jgi:hypothetical protein